MELRFFRGRTACRLSWPPLDVSGIGRGSHEDEIVPGDLARRKAVPVIDELLFRLWIVNQYQISVAPARRVESEAGA